MKIAANKVASQNIFLKRSNANGIKNNLIISMKDSMICDFKPNPFENTPSKNMHHTETSQQIHPANQKHMETLEINANAS